MKRTIAAVTAALLVLLALAAPASAGVKWTPKETGHATALVKARTAAPTVPAAAAAATTDPAASTRLGAATMAAQYPWTGWAQCSIAGAYDLGARLMWYSPDSRLATPWVIEWKRWDTSSTGWSPRRVTQIRVDYGGSRDFAVTYPSTTGSADVYKVWFGRIPSSAYVQLLDPDGRPMCAKPLKFSITY